MKHVLILGFALSTLTACTGMAEGPETPPTLTCRAGDYDAFVGLNIAVVTLPADLDQRVIAPGMAVTQDFRPDRLNIDVDETGVITRVWCG